MTIIADLAMLAWIPLVFSLFAALPPRRAVIIAYMVGWLFLPFASYPLPGLPDLTKMSATAYGVLLAAVVFDSRAVTSFRFRLLDLPMAVYCLTPFFSSVCNDLGMYDGISASLANIVTWGLPYLIGRVYFVSADALRELATAVFIGGLAYIPLCLFEVRMSPQLHGLVYGAQHRWGGMRMGGWRPSVFLDSGLQLGMWMTVATLIGVCLWRSRLLPKLYDVPAGGWVTMLGITTILCRSTGALALLMIGLACLWFTRASLTRLALIGLLAIAPAYLFTRVAGLWDGTEITNLAAKLDADRAQSFQFRLDNEDMLVAKAMQSPIVGWGGWGRSRIYDESGKDLSITDGLWIIELGTHGLLGLISLYTVMLMPLALLLWKFSVRQLLLPRLAPALVLAICVSLYAIDGLPNAMINPIFMLMAGGVATCVMNGALLLSAAERNGRLTNSEIIPPRAIVPRRLHTGGA